jgi:NAD(P)H-quinone oxidoreductase subunit 4L|uniref:NAD(P)H-quinone oxidoreductase subunit 4L, chloroplastic n=1 Tax=Chara vulgaris TaxID=55564 RepID=NU4LC_CHAVU|nr:NADH dehydrogenase subunit 4L [Chara vulgaris]Q1ACE7.1 RecName: Full=NAD(P)H-quinone oxidoreductase subunit 4L, chloroplastic; AltName: Full=NAD(P)H dehydrogenase subunit 4L; AltName: Full=NADH-plastoquinone oxidoreductase subunit 4L [Chara vulgaris]ABA61925.1 subunit 4L of NADH-plastoquinone oxidoreductase [Chara vulgaris]WAP91365.1 NADH dehydrogenase subunit 4L [Chara vulgaris]
MILQHILILSSFLFCLGIFGLITSQNMVKILICLELIFNAVNLNLVIFCKFFDSSAIIGNLFGLFIIAIAAAEAAIALAILLAMYRNRRSIRIDRFNILK